MKLFVIAIGGAAGAVLRFVLAGWVQSLAGSALPLGTLVANATGCFVFGLLATALIGSPAVPSTWPDAYRLLLLVGFCGGYTTFSSFAWETFALVAEGKAALAAVYVGLSNFLCLAGVWLGHRLTSP